MNIYQKIILGIGAIAFIVAVGIMPVRYDMRGTIREEYDPARNVYHYVDFYATSLRGIVVISATVAAWLIAGKSTRKKEEE